MKMLCCIFTVRKTFLEILPLVPGICWRRATYLGRTALSTPSTIEATVVFFLHIFCNFSFSPWFLVSICTLWRVLYRTDIPLHEFFNLVMTYKSSLHSSSVLQDPLPGDLVLSACLCAFLFSDLLLSLSQAVFCPLQDCPMSATSSLCQWNTLNPFFLCSSIAPSCTLGQQFALGRCHMDVLIGALYLAQDSGPPLSWGCTVSGCWTSGGIFLSFFGWSFKGLMFADVVLWLPYFTDGYVMTSIY